MIQATNFQLHFLTWGLEQPNGKEPITSGIIKFPHKEIDFIIEGAKLILSQEVSQDLRKEILKAIKESDVTTMKALEPLRKML